MKTGSESIEAILRKRQMIPFAGFVARTKDPRLPKCVMFGKLVRSAGSVGGRGESGRGLLLVSTSTSG